MKNLILESYSLKSIKKGKYCEFHVTIIETPGLLCKLFGAKETILEFTGDIAFYHHPSGILASLNYQHIVSGFLVNNKFNCTHVGDRA